MSFDVKVLRYFCMSSWQMGKDGVSYEDFESWFKKMVRE